jgi:hypothetical protein
MKNNKTEEGDLNKDDVAGPPVKPERNIPVKPDKNPDPTKIIPGINEPEKEDPTRIDEPKKVDPTRIDDPPVNI